MAKKFLTKLIFNGAVLIPLLFLLCDASWTQVILFSVVLSIIAFFVGDQWILRESNNTVATIADFGLAGIMLWAAADMLHWSLSSSEIIVVALVLGFVEAMFHRLLQRWDKKNKSFSIDNI
jgi:ABC-type Co2+ transport system permease subunit